MKASGFMQISSSSSLLLRLLNRLGESCDGGHGFGACERFPHSWFIGFGGDLAAQRAGEAECRQRVVGPPMSAHPDEPTDPRDSDVAQLMPVLVGKAEREIFVAEQG